MFKNIDREIDDNLREYYRRFLQDVRGLKQSTVKHYDEALKKISQILIAKEKIKNSIYEIRTLDRLLEIMEELKRDKGFLALDKRGHSMYSAGMNNYLKFANGEMFKQINRDLTLLDVPMPAREKIKRTVLEYPRTAIITRQVVQYADYRCEMDSEHQFHCIIRVSLSIPLISMRMLFVFALYVTAKFITEFQRIGD